ncbi:YrvL family regulatory protein [Oceanobacillus halotolerans]|uniref:YrvL family regulatory protein n=1 Tax=Oceanobacillus halotolerans TaxID=2663380 RepID=UPI001CF7CD1B|nr:YrvL family regulatory protein [Oceanobacillus halotolerans]
MGIIIGVYFLGIAGIFEILGVQYQSIWSLIIFVISIFILGLPVDLVLGAMADLSAEKISGKITAFVVQFLFGFVTNWIVIFTVDAFMSSINLSPGAKLFISLILTFFESVFGDKKDEHKKAA